VVDWVASNSLFGGTKEEKEFFKNWEYRVQLSGKNLGVLI